MSSAEKLLYVALDHNERKLNIDLAGQLSNEAGRFGFKVNLDHVILWGLKYVEEVQSLDKPVFVDLKVNNGERTMGNIFGRLAEMGVNHTNVWSFADNLIKPAVRAVEGSNTRVLGVTITTIFDDDYCQRHFGRSMRDSVRHFAQVAINAGCDGIILPGTCLQEVRDIKTVKLVSGIRPTYYHSDSDTQKQIVTPHEAIINGADILVCGSPIYKTPNPAESLRRILSQM